MKSYAFKIDSSNVKLNFIPKTTKLQNSYLQRAIKFNNLSTLDCQKLPYSQKIAFCRLVSVEVRIVLFNLFIQERQQERAGGRDCDQYHELQYFKGRIEIKLLGYSYSFFSTRKPLSLGLRILGCSRRRRKKKTEKGSETLEMKRKCWKEISTNPRRPHLHSSKINSPL